MGKPGGQHGNATGGIKTQRHALPTDSLQHSPTAAPGSSHDQPLQTTASLQHQPSAHSQFLSAGLWPPTMGEVDPKPNSATGLKLSSCLAGFPRGRHHLRVPTPPQLGRRLHLEPLPAHQ